MHSFLHSKLLNVLVDSVLNSLYDLVSVNIVTIDVIFLIARSRSLQVKIQLLRVNDLFDKDFKAIQYFGCNLPQKVSNFCSSIANQHHEDFVSPGGCHNTRFFILTEQERNIYR